MTTQKTEAQAVQPLKDKLTYGYIVTIIQQGARLFAEQNNKPMSYRQLRTFCQGHGPTEVVSNEELGQLVDLLVIYGKDINSDNPRWQQLWRGLKANVTTSIHKRQQQNMLSQEDYQNLALRLHMAETIQRNEREATLVTTWQEATLDPHDTKLTLKELQLLAMEYTSKVEEKRNDFLTFSNQLLQKHKKRDKNNRGRLQCDEHYALTGEELYQLSRILLECRKKQQLFYNRPSSWANVLLTFAAQRIETVLPVVFEVEAAAQEKTQASEHEKSSPPPLATLLEQEKLPADIIQIPNLYQQTSTNVASFHDTRTALTLHRAWCYYRHYVQHCGFFRRFFGGIFYPDRIKDLKKLLTELSSESRYKGVPNVTLAGDSLRRLMAFTQMPAINPTNSLSINVFKSLNSHICDSLKKVQDDKVSTPTPVSPQSLNETNDNSGTLDVVKSTDSTEKPLPSKKPTEQVTDTMVAHNSSIAQQIVDRLTDALILDDALETPSENELATRDTQPITNNQQQALVPTIASNSHAMMQPLLVTGHVSWESIAPQIAHYRKNSSDFNNLPDEQKLTFLQQAVKAFEGMLSQQIAAVGKLIEQIAKANDNHVTEQGLATITATMKDVGDHYRHLLLLLSPDKINLASEHHGTVGLLREQLTSVVKQQWKEVMTVIKLHLEVNIAVSKQTDLLNQAKDILIETKQIIIDHVNASDDVELVEEDGKLSIKPSETAQKRLEKSKARQEKALTYLEKAQAREQQMEELLEEQSTVIETMTADNNAARESINRAKKDLIILQEDMMILRQQMNEYQKEVLKPTVPNSITTNRNLSWQPSPNNSAQGDEQLENAETDTRDPTVLPPTVKVF